jgi:hypothetical protein
MDVNGSPTDGCVKYILGYGNGNSSGWLLQMSSQFQQAYRSNPSRLLALAREACDTAHDPDSCRFVQSKGDHVDMAAIQQEAEYRSDSVEATLDSQREERREKARESDARFNGVMGALQSMPGANDPNAILNAGNQQAASIRSIGDANAAAARQRIADQQAAQQQVSAREQQEAQLVTQQQIAVRQQAAQQAQEQASQSQQANNYLPPITTQCIRLFWEPRLYNWASFENDCGQAINLTWIAKSPNDHFGAASADIAAGQSANTGWSQTEVTNKGGFSTFVCPSGSTAVDAVTGQGIRSPNTDYLCKKQ